MKEFVTAAKREVHRNAGTEDTVSFLLKRNPEDEGTEIRAYRPEESQYVLFLAAVGMGSSGMDGVAGVVNFLLSVLDPASKSHVTSRLLDRDDPFGMEDLQEIMEYLVGEWSGRPTESPIDSSASPLTDGPRSTPSISGSISSDSTSTVF